MDRWQKVCIAALVLALISGASNLACAQTVFRNLELTESPAQQKAVIGLLGEFNYCAAYEVVGPHLSLNSVIAGAGGMTPQASGLIRIVRGGRLSQEVFYSPETDLPLMPGDVLIAVKSSANLINANGTSATAPSAASANLVQIAILNLRDYPVVFGVPAEIADLASILRCLRQPVEQYAEMAETIKIIPPDRRRSQAQFKTRKLTTRFESGTVIVLSAPQKMNLSLVPHSLPGPRALNQSASPESRFHRQVSAPSSFSANDSRFRNATPVKQEASIPPRQVTHPERETDTAEETEEKPKQKSLQLNGPLLQQTSATLAAIPNPLGSEPAEEHSHADKHATSEDHQAFAASSVPEMELGEAPAAPKDDVKTLTDDELPKTEYNYEDEEAGFWPPGTGLLLLAAVAFVLWRYVRKKPILFSGKAQQSDRDLETPAQHKVSSEQAAIITRWEELPPLPEKSLLEQILEKQIPVIDETPQIPTQTFIYGRHQSRKGRVDQAETLKGPHFLKQKEPDSKVAAGHDAATPVVPEPVRKPEDKKLKAPTFRFDRSHPGNSNKTDSPAAAPKPHAGAAGKTTAGSDQKTEQGGILDRVLQAVQGVMPR
ncbi:hypothetical protein Enr10x_49520 [Gimesia panareensis]|uniref:SLBB domain protein n=1 Tax=Gimesia panareensis TaxID=2527978 RepID=A0A517QD92_9PLAN|nr:hypothetical protein [Gimesia panareensis]QDT29597.1 hypothetical protein Enr10x_49520 [Gimesia panareensis]